MADPRSLFTFKTKDDTGAEKTWYFHSPKASGARSAGKHGGFYTTTSGSTKPEAFVKQDSNANNIAEFLAGKIYQATAPDVSARIRLTRVDEKIKKSEDGKNVYVVSEFIPGWKHDLYAEIQETFGEDKKRSKNFLKESFQIASVMRKLKQFFTRRPDLTNFGEVSGTSLLINNIDTHIGNLLIIETADGIQKLAVIDYGAGWRAMTNKINPHNFLKLFLKHLGEAWNNFRLFPESIKITPQFVTHLDKAIKTDLSETIEEAFIELREFYAVKPIVEFGIRAGLISQSSANRFLKSDHPEVVIDHIRNKAIDIMQARQVDLARFSAQIKLDLCVQGTGKKATLGGRIQYPEDVGRDEQTATDVMVEHIDYFVEVACGHQEFKFRQSDHKGNSHLLNCVKNEANIVIAALLIALARNNDPLATQSLAKIKAYTLDQVIDALHHGKLKGEALWKALAHYKDKKIITDARTILEDDDNSLILLAKHGKLNKEHHDVIAKLLSEGSNPNMKMPDGTKLINLTNDAETREQLVLAGASITSEILAGYPHEAKALKKLKKNHLPSPPSFAQGPYLLFGSKGKTIDGTNPAEIAKWKRLQEGVSIIVEAFQKDSHRASQLKEGIARLKEFPQTKQIARKLEVALASPFGSKRDKEIRHCLEALNQLMQLCEQKNRQKNGFSADWISRNQNRNLKKFMVGWPEYLHK